MNRVWKFFSTLSLAVCAFTPAHAVVSELASNACQSKTLATIADVTTSAGANYQVKTHYRTPKEMATTFIDGDESEMVIEGPTTWMRTGDDEQLADDRTKRFIVGHQFHALAYFFDDLVTDAVSIDAVSFQGDMVSARKGSAPFGGEITFFQHNNGKAAGLILNLPGETLITVRYFDWRVAEGGDAIPYGLTIDHDGVRYTYGYQSVFMSQGDAISFHDAFRAPGIDEVQIHRLHRALLAAHCRGDAALMGALTAPNAVIANRGGVASVSQAEIETRFQSVFSRVDYASYTDLADPKIDVAESGDLGWAIVNVEAKGALLKTEEAFSDIWAWALLARKIDGVWLNAGNASNRRTETD